MVADVYPTGITGEIGPFGLLACLSANVSMKVKFCDFWTFITFFCPAVYVQNTVCYPLNYYCLCE